ncbi:SDR family NAD(P)-dependent oxidoreductase, partial [Pseudomonas aeruginosa]
ALACGCDARQEQQVIDLFARIEGEVGALEAVIFNVGANVWFPITETTERVYRKVWEMAAFGGFFTGRGAARVMLPRRHGTIIITGATASLRGGAHFAALSGAKFALRDLAQSMARGQGAKATHVAHPTTD